jgi:hypothetical protein
VFWLHSIIGVRVQVVRVDLSVRNDRELTELPRRPGVVVSNGSASLNHTRKAAAKDKCWMVVVVDIPRVRHCSLRFATLAAGEAAENASACLLELTTA